MRTRQWVRIELAAGERVYGSLNLRSKPLNQRRRRRYISDSCSPATGRLGLVGVLRLDLGRGFFGAGST